MAYYGILKEEDAQCFSVNATVEAASWILVAASIILFLINHFVVGASNQKTQDDTVHKERRLYSDRWEKRKQSEVPVGITVSLDEDDEWLDLNHDDKDPSVSPIKPRFTDYYCFATKRMVQETDEESGSTHGVVETAVLPVNDSEDF